MRSFGDISPYFYLTAYIVYLCGTHIYPFNSNTLVLMFDRKLLAHWLLFNRDSDEESSLVMGYIYVWEHPGNGQHIDVALSSIFED